MLRRKAAALLAAVMVVNSTIPGFAAGNTGYAAERVASVEKLAEAGTGQGAGSLHDLVKQSDSNAEAIQYEIRYTVLPEEFEDKVDVDGPSKVIKGETLKFTVKPDKGYEVESVTADSEELEGKSGFLGLGRSMKYEVEDVSEAVEITVVLEEQELAAQMKLSAKTEVESASDAVYVSQNGDDEKGDGTEESPYQSLAKAVSEADSGDTIYVMSDLEVKKSARFYDKDLTITSIGGTWTLSRSEDFEPTSDTRRSFYNPAMIEVGSTKIDEGGHSTLVLADIILDDCGLYQGEYFCPAEDLREEFKIDGLKGVQDAIIATYNGTGTITLGDGAILQNFGGMSAVRLAGGELIMEEGSQIIDTEEWTRIKGKDKSYGPAGAVWIQGGTLTMNGGVIGGDDGVIMNGRAVYVDSGTANIGGTIQNIKGTNAAWMGQDGVAVHLRSHGEATLTSTGVITNVTGANAGNNCAIWTQFCNFTTIAGSEISKVDGFQLLHFDDLTLEGSYTHEVYFDGTISDCDAGSACLLRSWYGQITFGPNSVIEGCSSSSAGGLIYSNNGSHYTFAGTIQNNRASNGMIYLANQSGGGVIATIEETAHIVDNTGLGIRVNNSSNLTMNGGEIARNTGIGVKVSAKDNWAGVKFIMNDGVIADNGGVGVDATIGKDAVIQLNGGSIYGNGDGTEVQVWNDYTDSPNAYADSANDHLHIADGVLQGERTVMVEHGYSSFLGAISLNRTLGTITLDEGYGEVGVAFANPAAVTKMTDLVTAGENRANWKAAMQDAYWIKPNASSYHFEVTRPEDAAKTDLYLAYIPMNDDGTVPDEAELTLNKVSSGDQIDVTMDGLDADKTYAFMFFNSSEYTITADSITKYIGGGSGDEITGNGFPELTIDGSIDKITKLEISGAEVSADDLMAELLSHIEAIYTGEDGSVATDDSKPGEYIITLQWKDGLNNEDVRINGNSVNLDGVGKLIIRYVENTGDVQKGTNTHELLPGEPTAPIEHAEAIAKKGGWSGTAEPEFYTNDDEDRVVDAAGVQILDDGLLLEEDDNRQELMEQKAEEMLGDPGANRAYQYDFHYLDLVDAFNGNAWVSASYGTTVYLPYPDGITAETAEERGVTVLHYKDLHREYGISGQANVEDAIRACELEQVVPEFDPYGIKFDVDRSGFSPFAVVWKTDVRNITIHYVDMEGTRIPGIAPNPLVVESGFNKPYDVTKQAEKEILGYTLHHIDGAVTGDQLTNDIDIYVHYTKDIDPPAGITVTIDYLDKATGEKIADSWSDVLPAGEPYDVTPYLSQSIRGYAYVGYEGGEPAGDELNNPVTIHALYESTDPSITHTITINYLADGTGEKLAESVTVTGTDGESYNVAGRVDKEIEGYTISRVEGSVIGNSLNEDITVNVYYTKDTETVPEEPEGPEEPEKEQYSILILYLDKNTKNQLADMKVVKAEAGQAYDVTADANLAIDGYHVSSIVGTVKGDSLEKDLLIYVYYEKDPQPSTGNDDHDDNDHGGGSSSASAATYTAGTDGYWLHVGPEDINRAMIEAVPEGATPVTAPEWHQWKFILYSGGMLRNQWAYVKNPYAVNEQPREGWFCFNEDGIMQYGWYLDPNTQKWYYMHRNSDGMLGTRMEGWHFDEQDGYWYYLNPGTGEMLTGWQQIGGKWYYLNPTPVATTWSYNEESGGWTYNGTNARPFGSMYRNETTPDGYFVDGNGGWTE